MYPRSTFVHGQKDNKVHKVAFFSASVETFGSFFLIKMSTNRYLLVEFSTKNAIDFIPITEVLIVGKKTKFAIGCLLSIFKLNFLTGLISSLKVSFDSEDFVKFLW